jgi:hypothetical protein
MLATAVLPNGPILRECGGNFSVMAVIPLTGVRASAQNR